jgi:hypothetical protein
MGDPGIDPSDCIDRIRTIRGDPVTNEKIFRNRLIHPFFKPMLFFNRPPPITDFPDLIRGLKLLARRTGVPGHVPAVKRLAEAGGRNKKNQKEKEKGHRLILKRRREDCQQEERGKFSGRLCSLFPAEFNISFSRSC